MLEPRTVPSPCRNICRLKRGACIGCGRTAREIGDWPTASDAERHAILARARDRLGPAPRR